MKTIDCKCYVESRVSKKTGSTYDVLVINFPNGYSHVVYGISKELLFIIRSMCDNK